MLIRQIARNQPCILIMKALFTLALLIWDKSIMYLVRTKIDNVNTQFGVGSVLTCVACALLVLIPNWGLVQCYLLICAKFQV